MNFLYLTIKIFILDSTNVKINFKSLFPFVGTSLGVFIFIITFTIMDGIETDLKSNVSKIIPINKIFIQNLSSYNIELLKSILDENNITYYLLQENDFLVNNKNSHKLVTMLSINNIEKYINDIFSDYYEPINKKSKFIIGNNMYENDYLEIISTTNINLFTGVPKVSKFEIDGLINFHFMDFNNNFIFISSDLASKYKLFKNNKNKYFHINQELDNQIINNIKNINNGIVIINWKSEYVNLFQSIKLEKFLYSLFGIFIILISNFTFISILSSIIINKMKEFAILEVIGFNKIKLKLITLLYSVIQTILSLIIGITCSYLFIIVNDKYDFIGKIFKNNFLVNINYKISTFTISLIMIISIISIIIGVMYPIRLINQFSIKDKLNYLK